MKFSMSLSSLNVEIHCWKAAPFLEVKQQNIFWCHNSIAVAKIERGVSTMDTERINGKKIVISSGRNDKAIKAVV